MNLISLCMIVKNEEKLLPRCLESVQKWVDEIIIIDTGSDDHTKSIARQYTDHVYDFEWSNDFSAARNESLRYATGKWILVLDADEYVQNSGHKQLRQLLEDNNTQKPFAFILNIMNFTGSGYDETQVMESTGARLFRNHSAIRYTEAIHEQLTSSQGEIQFSPLTFTIFHSGYTQEIVQQKNKSQRNMSILNTMKSDHKNEGYYYFILGNEYANSKEMEQALHSYQRSHEKSKPTDTWYHHLMDRLITLEIQQDQHHLAYKNIQTGLKLKPHHTDYYCLHGILLDSLGYWNAAAREFEKCIQIASDADRNNTPYWVVQPTYGKIIPYQMLADIQRKKGDLSGAIQYWIKTLQLQPKNYNVLQLLVEHLLVVELGEQVESILEMIYPQTIPMNSVLLYKISLLTGNMRMLNHYQSPLDKLDIQLGYSDTILLHLLNKKMLNSIEGNSETIPSHIALMAAIVYNNMSFAEGAVTDPEVCIRLAQQALLALQDHTWDQEALEGNEQLFAQTLLFMWKYEYKELYLTLLQRMASARTINLLGHLYYQMGQTDEALELFSLLLDNQLLAAEGLKTIGQWYLSMGELTDGYPFIKASLEMEPSMDLLGRIQEYIPVEQRTELLHKYFQHYSSHQDIPIK